MNYLLAAAARAQAQAMLTELEGSRPAAADSLALSALAELQTWTDLTVRIVPDDQTRTGCSVAGTYLPGPPPELAVARSASTARQDFTALHELGHHLQQNSFALMDAFAGQRDGGRLLEDAACDAFAAEILIPTPLVETHLLPAGPTAAGVVDLWQAAGASRMAVCVRASQYLPAPGHVMLMDTSGRMVFAASHGLPPLRRGSDQSAIPVISAALASYGRAEGRTRVRYRDGIGGQELYVQVAPMGGYLVAVLVTDLAPWRAFAPSAPRSGLDVPTYICEPCDQEFESYAPVCTRCRIPPCPECGRCGCPSPVAERLCPGCFTLHPPRMYADGSDRCLNCS
jgi:hypothetical protein